MKSEDARAIPRGVYTPFRADLVCVNPYYEPPDMFLRQGEVSDAAFARKRVEWWIAQLKRAQAIGQKRKPALEKLKLSERRLAEAQQVGMDQRFTPELETTAYRIVQEALTNVVRHAGVTGVALRLWATPEVLNVQVQDRGSGFVPEAVLAWPQSNGLTGMQERVKLFGGHLSMNQMIK